MSARLCIAAPRIVLAESYRLVEHSLERPGAPAEIAEHVDWQATFAQRRRLDELGFAVAEAMDTAQRFAIGWPAAERLIRGTGELRLAHGFVAGASADHLSPGSPLDEIVTGTAWQARLIQEAGGVPVILPIAALARRRAHEQDYLDVYRALVERLPGPLLVHWLGPQFLSELAGYFPGRSFERVMALDREKLAGAKLSLLDERLELRLRRELASHGQILFTGDDLHFAHLLLGGDPDAPPDAPPPSQGSRDFLGRPVALGDFSHALLGVLDGVAAPARAALQRLEQGEVAGYLARMLPLEELGRWMFCEPTRGYRAGLAFLAWVDGRQSNLMLANHEERLRDAEHHRRLFELARAAGALEDAARAERRLASLEDELAPSSGPRGRFSRFP